ncbi:MAG: hypothetical protein P8P83_00145 [Rickettsiaceae bacterium]|nr:hypothetical protein [Rickettsiaceae bacterium]
MTEKNNHYKFTAVNSLLGLAALGIVSTEVLSEYATSDEAKEDIYLMGAGAVCLLGLLDFECYQIQEFFEHSDI